MEEISYKVNPYVHQLGQIIYFKSDKKTLKEKIMSRVKVGDKINMDELKANVTAYRKFGSRPFGGNDRIMMTYNDAIWLVGEFMDEKQVDIKAYQKTIEELRSDLAVRESKELALLKSQQPCNTYTLTLAGNARTIKAHGYREVKGWLEFFIYTDEVEEIVMPVGMGMPIRYSDSKKAILNRVNKDLVIEIASDEG
jgi:hypothetical protein